ncbi:MAG: tRNA (adenosine(37)-N6)-threonylcarbamoyltransferase complex dimerization subunit type 1 TsaB [Spirochaetales bacterium]|nr:MAG: tRNA (adenosine(37)-N6)-threonylcarbamoyltransferase complex dimerization subunit type 1 TsaB [Spirochaetales bacterium]
MKILALECSGKILSAALRTPDGLWEISIDAGFHHVETLMSAVSSLMDLAGEKPSSLDLTACSAGPGSFTALRIGMSTAKGIARGAGCHLKTVPTLPLLAAGREHWPGIVIPVMDARKKRVYAAAFRQGERIHEDADTDLKEFLEKFSKEHPILVTGPDAGIASEYPGITVDPLHAVSRAAVLADMAADALRKEGPDPPDTGPLYLRLSEAEENQLQGKIVHEQ